RAPHAWQVHGTIFWLNVTVLSARLQMESLAKVADGLVRPARIDTETIEVRPRPAKRRVLRCAHIESHVRRATARRGALTPSGVGSVSPEAIAASSRARRRSSANRASRSERSHAGPSTASVASCDRPAAVYSLARSSGRWKYAVVKYAGLPVGFRCRPSCRSPAAAAA